MTAISPAAEFDRSNGATDLWAITSDLRHQMLSALGFNPTADVAAADGGGGGWQWATEKPELHRYVGDFFATRREDG